MTDSRRAYLGSVGTVVLGLGLAGCGGDTGEQTEATTADGAGSNGGEPTASGDDTTAGSDDRVQTDGGRTTQETPSTDPAATDLAGTVAERSNADLKFVRHNHYEQNGIQGVTGVLRNAGSQPFTSVTVRAEVAASDGSTAGPFTASSADEGRGGLEPGDRWRFKFRFGDDAPDDPQGYTVRATGETGDEGFGTAATEGGATEAEVTGAGPTEGGG